MKIIARSIAVAALGLLTALTACAAGRDGDPANGQAAGEKFVQVFLPNGKAVTAELAVTDAERQQGLMFRTRMRPEQGMLFVFEEPDYHSFWMKNTKIALDMLWLDADRRIVEIEKNVPPCLEDPCPSYGGNRPALFVLELIAGQADAHGLKLFDRLDFVLPPQLRR